MSSEHSEAGEAYNQVALSSVLMSKEAYLGRTKTQMLCQRLRASYQEMSILRDEMLALEAEVETVRVQVGITRAKKAALEMQQVCLEQESNAPDWRLKRQLKLQGKVLSADKQQDLLDAKRIEDDLNETRNLCDRLEATRHNDVVTFDHELATQLRDMTQLTHMWNDVRKQRTLSEAALEEWRITRVKAQADSTEYFRTGAHNSAKEDTPTMQLIAQAMLSKEERERSRTKLHTHINRLYLDQVPLFKDTAKEIEILEMLPHIKRLMMLQTYSQRFTQLGRYINFLHLLLRSTDAMKSLGAPNAMSTIVEVGREVLQADHVVLYRQEDRTMWSIAPESLHSKPEEIGRGLAGYVAQVQKEVRLNNVASSGIYDAEVDDIKVGPYDVHSAMLIPTTDKHCDKNHCIVKAMRGWNTLANTFNQDDATILGTLAVAVSQVTNHHQQWSSAIKLDRLSREMFVTAHRLMCCHEMDHVLTCASQAITRLCTCEYGIIHMLQADRRNPSFLGYGNAPSIRRCSRPWQQSLLRRCFKKNSVVICNQPKSDPGYIPEVDSPLASGKLRNTLFVPVHSASGGVVGVLQAINLVTPPATVMRPILDADGFTEQDVGALKKLARYTWIALSAAKQFGFCRDHFNGLHGLPVKQGLLDTLRGLQFKLKEGFGVESAKILTVDHEQQQLCVPSASAQSAATYPLTRGLAARVAKSGCTEVVRFATSDKAFDKDVDGHDVPPDNIISLPVYRSPKEPAITDGMPQDSGLPDKALPEVVAVIQATNKRRGFFGTEDIKKAAEFSVRASCMLNLSSQLDRRKHHHNLQTTLVNLMYKIAFAKGDPFRRSSVIEDMALSLFNGEAGHYLEQVKDGSWSTSPTGNAKVKARAISIAAQVKEQGTLLEDIQGSLDARDDFFGTTIKPNMALGAPVVGKAGAFYGVIVVQRHSIERYTNWEKQALQAVCRRIALTMHRLSGKPAA